MKKIIRSTTIGGSLDTFCYGLLSQMKEEGYEVVALSSPDEDLRKLGEREGVRTIGVPMERRMSPWKDFLSLCKLVRVLLKEKPDMIHSMTPKAGLLCMIAAWVARVPIRIHTFTGLVWPTTSGMTRYLLMATDKLTCACATHVIPEGQGVLEDLQNGGITRKPMHILGYGNVRGVDLDFYSRRSELLEKSKRLSQGCSFRFVFVGRIVGDKGINELIDAFSEMLNRHPDCRLTLVGRFEKEIDPVTDETKRKIDSIDAIEAVGTQLGDDLLAYYAASDCFVFPSYREGFPNTVLEAGAMGLPSIVTDINGSREIVVDYKKNPENATGLIVPSKNTEALLEAMEWMVTHEEERKLMAANARPRIEQRWEQGFVRGCLLDFYRSVLS